jgi:hypothetical protein
MIKFSQKYNWYIEIQKSIKFYLIKLLFQNNVQRKKENNVYITMIYYQTNINKEC